jgi:nicotinate dehydrogenase subunit A
MKAPLHFVLNGRAVSLASALDEDAHERTLLDVLRHDFGLKATRMGCAQGQCGACTVLLGQEAVMACETAVSQVSGAQVTTLEGLGNAQAPHPLQSAFIHEQAAQCGFCTSGLIMQSAALLMNNVDPSREDIERALEGNLCRCGVHERVIKAVLWAREALKTPPVAPPVQGF